MNIMITTLKSPFDERDYTIDKLSNKNFPSVLDLTEKLPKVRNQGSQGSCAAHTAACIKEWQELMDIGFYEYMSPQFIYNNRENQDSEGMYPRDVMKILNKLGCCSETSYPYGTIEDPKNIDSKIYQEASKYKIKKYARIYTIDGLKNALFNHGPCLIAVPVYNYTGRMWKQRDGDTYNGGHAMTVVGYNNNGFLIRNSWGNDWCNNGYTTLDYNDWDLIWEVWSTIDEKTIIDQEKEKEEEDTKKNDKNENEDSICSKFFKLIFG